MNRIRGVRGIIFRGGKVIFPDVFPGLRCFFPVEYSHFGRATTNFSGFEKWKVKKKKKKKKKGLCSASRFHVFQPSISNFPTSLLQFSFFSFHFLFSLPLFSRYVSKNFPVKSVRGTVPCPLPVTPLDRIYSSFKHTHSAATHAQNQWRLYNKLSNIFRN